MNVFVVSLCPGCVPMQEGQWAPAHFRRKQEVLAKCSVLESCVSQTPPNLKAIFCAFSFNTWFMLVSCGVSASLGECYSTMGVIEMEKWQRSQTRVSHVQHCLSSSPGSLASGIRDWLFHEPQDTKQSHQLFWNLLLGQKSFLRGLFCL